MNEELTFDQIEAAFPEEGAYSSDDGYIKVSAQWLHEFARNIAKQVMEQESGT